MSSQSWSRALSCVIAGVLLSGCATNQTIPETQAKQVGGKVGILQVPVSISADPATVPPGEQFQLTLTPDRKLEHDQVVLLFDVPGGVLEDLPASVTLPMKSTGSEAMTIDVTVSDTPRSGQVQILSWAVGTTTVYSETVRVGGVGLGDVERLQVPVSICLCGPLTVSSGSRVRVLVVLRDPASDHAQPVRLTFAPASSFDVSGGQMTIDVPQGHIFTTVDVDTIQHLGIAINGTVTAQALDERGDPYGAPRTGPLTINP